jgi:hypothetical protein
MQAWCPVPAKVKTKGATMSTKTEFEKASEGKPPGIAREFLLFLAENKKWWLLPIALSFLLFGLLAALATTGAAPLIYTLF